ncbi:unnamed protein product, partial [Tilletia caries]
KSHKGFMRKKAIKSEQQQTKATAAPSSTSKNISSTQQTSQSSSSKKRPASNKTASTSARKLTPDPFEDVDSSGEDEPKSKKQKSKALTAVQRLNQLAKERGLDFSNDESDEEMKDVDGDASASSISKEITIPVHKASSAAPKATIFRPAPTSVSRPATNSDPTTQMGSKLPVPFKITTAAPASSQRAPQTTSAVPSPALGNMRAVDTSKLEDPTAMALRSALQVRFSELPETEEVDDALQLLETVDSCGASKDSNGDPAFVAWLEELEKLDPATIDDEDELG